jgi:outer membrane protein assembly factor BamB
VPRTEGQPSSVTAGRAAIAALLLAVPVVWLLGGDRGEVRPPSSPEVVLPAPDERQEGPAAMPSSDLRIVAGVPGAADDLGWCLELGGGQVATTAPATGVAVLLPDSSGEVPTIWSTPRGMIGTVAGRAASDGTSIVVATATGELRSLDAEDGTERWQITDATARQQPWFRDGLLLVHDGREIVRLDPDTGEQHWRVDAQPLRRFVGTIEVLGDRVYVGQTREQRERFVQAATDLVVVLDRASGDEIRQVELLDPIRQHPPKVLDVGIHEGELVTLERDGLVVARDLDDASVHWRRPVTASASSLHTSESGIAVLVETSWQVPRGLGDEPAQILAQAATDQGLPCRLIAAEAVTAEQ